MVVSPSASRVMERVSSSIGRAITTMLSRKASPTATATQVMAISDTRACMSSTSSAASWLCSIILAWARLFRRWRSSVRPSRTRRASAALPSARAAAGSPAIATTASLLRNATKRATPCRIEAAAPSEPARSSVQARSMASISASTASRRLTAGSAIAALAAR